jgi:hypothetical protein
MLLTDPNVKEGLVGIPHYLHSMVAYACVFLLKVASQYTGHYIDDGRVLNMTSKVVHQFRSTSVSKYHLVHLMADGLEKMASSKLASPSALSQPGIPNNMTPLNLPSIAASSTAPPLDGVSGHATYLANTINTNLEEDFFIRTSPFLHFEPGNFDYNFGGPSQ